MEHIFISYSRKDEKQVTRFVKELRSRNFEIWQDISGQRSGIPCSTKWFEVIEEAILMAHGAIIFRTEAWECSAPCQKEFQIIQEIDLPFMYISMERFLTEENVVIDEAARWCNEQISSLLNRHCRWMFLSAFRNCKGIPVEFCFSMSKGIVYNLSWLMNCKKIQEQLNFHELWDERIETFMRKARKWLLRRGVYRILSVICFLTIFICVLTNAYIVKLIDISSETGINSVAVSNEMYRISKYDPVYVTKMIEKREKVIKMHTEQIREYGDNEYPIKNQGDHFAEYVFQNYENENRILTEMVSLHYPIAFYEAASECPVELSVIEAAKTSSRYKITLSDVTAQVFIYDKVHKIVRQLLLAAVPEVYCFDKDGKQLVIAAANEVYVYDLAGEAQPVRLVYNFEDIRDLIVYEDKIYAMTQNNHIVVWNTPFLERTIHRKNVASGKMMQLDDGRIMAVYVDGEYLIKNIDNNEESYSLPFQGVAERNHISVSSDCKYVAVSYKPDENDHDWIGVIDLSNGTLKRTYDTGCEIAGYTFSENNEFVIITCYDKAKIARINLATGEMQESVDDTYSNPYTVITHGERILTCDIFGILTTYNANLEQERDYQTTGINVPQKQLAVSKKYNCLLTAGRGGNFIYGTYRTELSGDKQYPLIPIYSETMISTTSIAVTNDGNYAAYGNAGGSIYIWDVGNLQQVRNEHCISDAIVNLLFSDDSKTLYVLGNSGTVYEIDISDITSRCVPAESQSIWQMQMDKAKEMKRNMAELGLYFDKT